MKRPTIAPGGRAFVYMSPDGQRWSVRVQMPDGVEGAACERISPVFALQTTAYAYLDWVTGAAPSFVYPEGEA